MKSKMRKKLIAFMLCMVLVICNSVSILADTPAAETTTAGEQVKETRTAKNENASDDKTGGEDEKNVSKQSEESDKDTPPEVTTTEKKKETTETTTEKKEETTTEASTEKKETTTAAKDETTETTTEDKKTTETTTEEKATTEAAEETSTTGEKEETDEAEEDGEKDKNNAEETTTEAEEKTTEASDEETIPAELTYDDENVTVTVSAVAEGAIPEGATLKVVPILKDDTETQAQYAEVEAKIQEKAVETETEIKGFLAYDITFVDADGNEIEPNSEVKVSMEYKEAAIPAELTTEDVEDAEVSVMHLEEDDAGNVSEVVDMGEAGKVDTLETTDAKQVEKVEVKTESFSVFTIQWNRRGPKLEVEVVDPDGETLLDREQSYTFSYNNNDDRVNVTEIAQQIEQECNIKDNFNKAVYVRSGEEFSFNAKQVHGLYYRDSSDGRGFRYTSDSTLQESWTNVGSGTIYFIFGEPSAISGRPVDTVSTNEQGIKINLFDYQATNSGTEAVNGPSAANANEAINREHILKFFSGREGVGDNANTINIKTNSSGSGVINSGMVQENLGSDGYPILARNYNESLGYLFDGNNITGAKAAYTGLDNLFVEEDGYYLYDSDRYYAYLKYEDGTFANNFTVSSGNLLGFFPFTDIRQNKSNNQFARAEGALNSTDVNHYFGMTISTGFLQPEEGKIDGQDMIFEFSGDDDVWVFIDDKLVLDLGGIHGKVSGTINFSTGEVTRTDLNGSSLETKSLKEVFGLDGNTFDNYSNHTMKFFYLERGNDASNCMIKFNLQTIPENSVAVTKEVVNAEGSTVNYAEDIDFQFNIKKQENNQMKNYSYQEYTVYENAEKIDEGTTDENGNFSLKHGQTAVFEGFLATNKYQITETGAYLNGYEVSYNGESIDVSQSGSDEKGETIYSATTGPLEANGVDRTVVFKNTVDNTTQLNIKKEFAVGTDGDANQEFQVYVEFQGKPFNGTYGKEGIETSFSAQNGIIYLKANETATISGLPYGTSFEVYEIQDGSYIPSYAVAGSGIYDTVLPDAENEVYSVSGKVMNQNQDSVAGTITVTNTKVEGDSGKTSVSVHKVWDEIVSDDLLPPYVTVTLYKDVNNNGELDNNDTPVIGSDGKNMSAQLKKENWSYTWDNLEPDVNYVVKEEYPPGYEFKSLGITNAITDLVLYSNKVAPNREQDFHLKGNSLLLVKPTNSTSDGEYVLWSPINLNLTATEIEGIIDSIKNQITGAGSIDNKGVTYEYGTTQLNGITLEKDNNGGWNLKFEKTSSWSLFWAFQYDRTQNVTLTNTLDTDYEISVGVQKKWEGDSSEDRPSDITVQLYQNNIAYDSPVVIKEENGKWEYTFSDLPYYGTVEESEGTQYIKNSYTVKELKIGNAEIDDSGQAAGYKSTVTGNQDDGFVITNILNEQWEIVKKSSSKDNTGANLDVPAGAEFTLTGTSIDGDSTYSYRGKVEENPSGVITWKDETGRVVTNEQIPAGTYTLTEIKAPAGYVLSEESWTLYFTYQGAVPEITKGQESYQVAGVKDEKTGITTYTFVFENKALYALPSAGGPGIYWYTLSGTLLMAGAALIVYRQKRKREVLLRK